MLRHRNVAVDEGWQTDTLMKEMFKKPEKTSLTDNAMWIDIEKLFLVRKKKLSWNKGLFLDIVLSDFLALVFFVFSSKVGPKKKKTEKRKSKICAFSY